MSTRDDDQTNGASVGDNTITVNMILDPFFYP